MWMLRRRIINARVLYMKMFARKRIRLSGENRPPDLQKFARNFIALVMRQKYAVGCCLLWIAPSDYINKNAPAGEPVESGRHARSNRRRHDAWPHRDQKLQPLCAGHQ
jgi:hypothetical protein